MVVGFFSFLGSLTGILVETSIAAKLGLSKSSDTFYVAFTLPYIITNLITATGQFSLVPFFSALDARHSGEELWRGLSYAVNVVFLGLSVIAVVGAAAAPWGMRGIAPGLTAPQTALATELCQWLFLVIIPAGVAEVFRSFLFSQHRFALPSAAGFFRNVTVIAGILLGFGRYGDYSIVLGYFAGYLLQLAILGGQILAAFPVRYSLTLVGTGESFQNLRGAGAAQLSTAMLWQGMTIVERMIASFLPAGTLTALNYGFKIVTTISELLAGSVGTAALPVLARASAQRSDDEERKTFRHALEIVMVLVSPVMIFCLMLPHPIIRLVFQRGNFTAGATALMSRVFFYYSLSLLVASCLRVLGFYLFARREIANFLRLAVFYVGFIVVLDLFYVVVLRLGAKGIPLGLLTSACVASGLAYHRNVAGLRTVLDRSLGVFTAKNLLGAGLAALGVWALRSRLELPQSGVANFLYLCERCGVGSIIFFGTLVASRVLKPSEVRAVWQQARDA